MKISEHLTYKEITYSSTARKYNISNEPTTPQLNNIKEWAENIFELVREHFDTPIHVNSVFRSAALNEKLKGADGSQHLANNGAAGDLDADKYGVITNYQIFHYIKDNIEFDQLIWEFGNDKEPAFVHCSFNKDRNRGQILRAAKNSEGKTTYTNF